MADLRIGIDVGGTNTDAVLIDASGTIVASAKRPTTPDPADAIEAALGAVLPEEPGTVGRVCLGTTHAINAVLERRDLAHVAVVRIGAPATRSVPPLTGWPDDVREAVEASTAIVRGGVEIDGRLHPLDLDEVRRALESAPCEAVAVTGTFSLLDASQEEQVLETAREVLGPDIPVSLGHRVGGLGLLARENAAVLNAALGPVARAVATAFESALRGHDLSAAAFLAQNDGTIVPLDRARELPVLTIGSGAANSIRGAAALARVTDAIVIDVGGTSTEVGAVASGFPRESGVGATIGGVATNFRMPDVVSVAVGGGTVIDEAGELGARSVGAALTQEALVFGGATPTLTDAAVAAGRADIGSHRLQEGARFARALARAQATVADAVDRVRVSPAPQPTILVGGGAVILTDDLGGGKVLRPHGFDVANAVGAALARIAGEADRVFVWGPLTDRDDAIAGVTKEARDEAVRAGADPTTIETIWVEETALAYLDVPAARIRAKVAGEPRRD